MHVKSVFSPHLGRDVKFGRNRPAEPVGPERRMDRFLHKAVDLPTPPRKEDWSPAAKKSLSNIYMNDSLGCCVVSGGYHVLGVWTGNSGKLFVANDGQIVRDYGQIGGYVPGDPSTDQGCDEITAFEYWTKTGFASGDKLSGWITVDATNKQQLMLASYLFENVYFGVELPDHWVNPFPSGDGFVWDVAGPPNPDQGHCIIGCGYNDFNKVGVEVDTWGLLGTVTYPALAKYFVDPAGGNAYSLISPAILSKAKAKAPNGLDWKSLISYFDDMGGHIPQSLKENP